MLSHPKSVLIVEDDPDVLEAMCFILENAGYLVATATNGAEALDCLRTEAPPRLILLDLMMPIMDGWHFRSEQARDEKLAAIPVVILTGAGKMAEQAASLGAA